MNVGTAPPGPTRWLLARTRFLDRLAALVLLPVLGPVAGALALVIRLRDGPPALIGLPRSGRDGVTFQMWKLRTMRAELTDGSSAGASITAAADARVTPLGWRLRRWRLDELPQLLNVISGDMGLLGPRPETPSLVEPLDPAWAAVLVVRPGITGATQLVVERWEAAVLEEGDAVARYRSDILPLKLAVDRWYVERSSPRLDLGIAWSMVERFVLGRDDTWVQRRVRREVPAAAALPAEFDR